MFKLASVHSFSEHYVEKEGHFILQMSVIFKTSELEGGNVV